MIKFNGIFPPLPTSFYNNEELAVDKMKENILKLSKYDLSGFLVLGSNGELINLTQEEKFKVYDSTREAIPQNKLMLAGTGGQSTKETIQNTNAAFKSGADAALVLNPSYYKSLMSQEALVTHYWSVAESSEIPIIIYNMPANSGLDMDADTIVKISTHENIIGLKDSGGNLVKMGTIKKEVKPNFQILAGSAGFLLPALSIGAVGGILALANILPQNCINIYHSFKSNKIEEAQKTQLELVSLNSAVTSKWGVPALKAAMDYLGFYGGLARKPILPINEKNKKGLIELIEKIIKYQ